MKREAIFFIRVFNYDLRTKIEDSYSVPQRILMDSLSSDLSFYQCWPKAVINHVSNSTLNKRNYKYPWINSLGFYHYTIITNII